MKLRIKVTDEDIRLGRRQDCNRCPVARAAKRLVKAGLRGKVVVAGEIYIEGFPAVEVSTLSGDLDRFIFKFDEGESVKPTEFIVDMPLEVIDEKVFQQVRF